MDELRAMDPGAELFWNGVGHFWSLYRVDRQGAGPSDDWMLKELDFKGPNGEYRPLGSWALEFMRKARISHFNTHASHSRSMAEAMIEAEEKRNSDYEKRCDTLQAEMWKEGGKAFRGKTSSLAGNEFVPRDRPKAGRKRIVGSEAPIRETVI